MRPVLAAEVDCCRACVRTRANCLSAPLLTSLVDVPAEAYRAGRLETRPDSGADRLFEQAGWARAATRAFLYLGNCP
eukprot:3663917-Prymnesium_polylepis.1